MNTWKETNTRGFCVTFSDGISVTIQGPDLSPEEASETFTSRWPHKGKTVSNIEEYHYEDTVKWKIESAQKQISICLNRIKELDSELETV